jgi:hypothetical protein
MTKRLHQNSLSLWARAGVRVPWKCFITASNSSDVGRKLQRRRTRRRNSGLMIMAALVCLLVVTSIVTSMLHGAMRAHRELLAERDCRQAELLLQAGAGRAAARVVTEPDFRGDVWSLSAADIASHGDGRVTTSVSRPDNQSWQVHVIAEYPLGRNFPIKRSRTFEITNSKTQSQE